MAKTSRLALVALFALGIAASSARAADLTVVVNGVEDSNGKMVFFLFKDANGWPTGTPTVTATVAAHAGQTAYTYKGLPPGHYAVTGFHDEGGSGKMKYSLIGLPEEGYFFSNDKEPGLASPPFDACTVVLARDPVTINIRMQHWADNH